MTTKHFQRLLSVMCLSIMPSCSQPINESPSVKPSTMQVLPKVLPIPTKQLDASTIPQPTALASITDLPVYPPSQAQSPIASASPTPQPLNQNSTCDVQRNILEGNIQVKFVDITKQLPLLSQITITVKSLNPLVPYAATTNVKNGSYHLENFPLNTSVEISIFKEKYLVQRKIWKLVTQTNSESEKSNQDFHLYFYVVKKNQDSDIYEDMEIIDKIVMNGKIVNEQGQPILNAKVSLIFLTVSVFEDGTEVKNTYIKEAFTDKEGTYIISNLPSGLEQAQITVSKPRFATIKYFIDKIFSNRQGDPDLNRYNFGLDLKGELNPQTALADAPLVVDVGLTQTDEIHINPATAFKLKFSEPMNTSSVEKSMLLNIFEVKQKPDEQPISCVPQSLDSSQPITTFRENDFMTVWNTDLTEVEFHLKTLLKLPKPDKVWFGQMKFSNQIFDITGIARSKAFFRLNNSDAQEHYWLIFK